MILDKLIRRRWQHPDAGTRRQAVAELASGHPVLPRLARTDPDMGVRSAALSRMDDFDQVLEIGQSADDQKLRDAATARLCGLLSVRDTDLDIAACLDRLDRVGFSGVAEKLCRRGKYPEARILALARVRDQALLLEAACEDPVADVRFAAVTGIHDRKALDQALRQARKKDKRVARHAKECLDALAARERALHRMAELCEALEALRDSPTDDLRVKRLLDEADPLREQVNEVLRERLEQAHENWLESRARYERQRAEWAEAVAKHESLLESLEQLALDLEGRRELNPRDQAVLEAAVRTFQIGWEDADPLPDAARGGFDARYRALRERIRASEHCLQENHERAQALRDLDRQARACSANDDEQAAEETREQLRVQAAGLPWPQDKALHAELTALLRESLGDARREDRARDRQVQRELKARLQALERAVEQGEVKAATRAESRIKALLNECPPEAAATERSRARLRALNARLQSLHDWRRWGSGQAREELLAHVEALPDLETDPEKLAKAIRTARASWQRMDKAGDRPEEGAWERFDQACTRAYAPCTEYFEARAKERDAHLEAREAVLTDLEALTKEVGRDQPDWKVLDRKLRDIQRRWREAGTVGRKDWKRIETLYKQRLQSFEEPLREEQARNLEERKRLIEWVEALKESPDLQQALEETKQAQRQWKVTVPQGRKREQKLWERFRTACDQVFERRKQEREARDQIHIDNLAAKQALCERAEALLDSGEDGVWDRWRGLVEEWVGIGPVPKSELRALEVRWAKLEKRVKEVQLRRRLRAIREPVLDLKARLADLIAAEEALLQSETAQLPPSLQGEEPESESRLVLLQRALDEGVSVLLASAEQALGEARTLCIHAELLAETESPEEDAELRMQIQVERLQQAMTETQASDPEIRAEQAAELERTWWLLGPMRREHREVLGARLERALAVVWGDVRSRF